MKRLAALALLPCTAFAAGDVLSVMRDELARSRSLRLPNLEPPYYIEYSLDDAESIAISASLGGIVSQRHERARLPEVRVRVGGYKFDNTSYAGGFYGGFDSERFPLDDLYAAMRRHFWLATDNAYKLSLEMLSRKRAALRNVALPEPVDDFAPSPPLKYVRGQRAEAFDETGWAERLRRLSALLAGHALKNSSLEFEAIRSTHAYVNSEGSEVQFPENLVFLRARVLAQSPDGMTVRDAAAFHSVDLDGLPPEPELARSLDQLAAGAAALARAPRGEDYSGPVLFEGIASAQLFAEVLGRNFALMRRPVMEPGRPGVFPYSELDGRQGARILPEFFDVVDDPTQTEWRGRRLFGSYPADREGVAPKPVFLVEKGVLKNFLMTRQPVRGRSGSNGRARLPGAFGANSAAISNLFVRASEASTLAQLKRKLIEICNVRGKPYGLLVRKMDFPSSASFEEVRRLIAGSAQGGSARPVSMPVLLYKVYADGREELVRGLRFRGLNARSFKDVLAAANDEHVFEFLNNTAPFALMGAGGYVAETCVVAPSVLIDDLELHPAEEELPKLPVVPPPV